MSSGEDEDIRSIQKRINLNIYELEDQIKKKNLIWTNGDNQVQNDFLHSLIENHYREVIYHINQVKHHLQQIDYHRKGLRTIKSQLNTTALVENGHEHIEEPNAIKKTEENRLRKIRRVTRSSSLKYVEQWEKMLEEQKDGNLLNTVKRRWKSQNDFLEVGNGEIVDNSVSKTMVKNRIQKFEGFTKPKRLSSTVEGFLEFSVEKFNKAENPVIAEDVENEIRIPCECQNISGDGNNTVCNCEGLKQNKDELKLSIEFNENDNNRSNINNGKFIQANLQSKLKEDHCEEFQTKQREYEEEQIQTDQQSEALENNKAPPKEDNVSCNTDINASECKDDIKKKNSEEITENNKPRIVGIQLKDSSPTDVHSE